MRLLIVSNRLPVTVTVEEGEFRFQGSAGGLATGMSTYLESLARSPGVFSDHIWVGWPGVAVEGGETRGKLKAALSQEFNAYPVFLSEEVMERFYRGFCNETIWPLFHYFPTYAVYDEEYWAQYKSVNEMFSDAVMEVIRPDDVVWIHDYHLMLLPRLVREKMPDIPIGFFLHIPFPSFEIFRLLPMKWRAEILSGLLGSDFLGFHTHDYTQYFLRCVLRILGHDHDLGAIATGERLVRAETIPIGIDFQKFNSAPGTPEMEREKEKFKGTLAGLKVVLSVDRLDYTKGIINRLRGYEIFLERNPRWHKKVVLVLLVVPSRIGVRKYDEMKKEIDELAGKIIGKFGGVDWTPVLYQYRFLPFHPLSALYNASDIALVTPLRDGMNLIAKEYVASRTDKSGVLILSEMAGASKELGEAIIINPNNVNEIADAIKAALEMPAEEQVRRNQIMQDRIAQYDVVRWANDFLDGLLSVKEKQKIYNAKLLDAKTKGQLVTSFKNAQKRLIFIDYDGTLVPFVDQPQMAKPTEDLLKVLKRLSEDLRTEIVIVSGRDRSTLEKWFGSLAIGLVAEHGVWLKEKDKNWQMIKPLTSKWKPLILPILHRRVRRAPGAFVEEKEFSVVWHYRKVDPEFGEMQAKELMDDLINFTANVDVQVLRGSKVVEVRNAGVNKGFAGLHWVSKGGFDFIMAVGDDWTDEDLFKILPESAYTLRVGMTGSYARFNLRNYKDARKLIEELAK